MTCRFGSSSSTATAWWPEESPRDSAGSTISKSLRLPTLVEGVALAHEFGPDVVLIDSGTIEQEIGNGIRSIRDASGTTTVLVLGAHVDGTLAANSITAGASGAVEKTRDLAALAVAIRASARGEKLIVDQHLLPEVLRGLRGTTRPATTHLTPREREVLTLLDEGLDAPRIAERLGIARNTARNYVQNVLVKFDAHSRLEAVRARPAARAPPSMRPRRLPGARAPGSTVRVWLWRSPAPSQILNPDRNCPRVGTRGAIREGRNCDESGTCARLSPPRVSARSPRSRSTRPRVPRKQSHRHQPRQRPRPRS